MESKILDGSRVNSGIVELQLDSYVASFILVSRNEVEMRVVIQVGKHRGSAYVPPEQRSIMFRDARAILKGRKTAQSDCGW